MSVALDTSVFKLLWNPHAKRTNYRTKQTRFGDGYREITLDGINYEEEEYDLAFVPMSDALSNALETVLKNSVNGTTNCLSWSPIDQGSELVTMSGELVTMGGEYLTMGGSSVTKYWIARDIQKTPLSNTLYRVTCTLERIYPLS